MVLGVPVQPTRAPRLRLTCFGVGDGWPSATQTHSSFLYQIGNQTLLADCGEPIGQSFKASGLDYNLIDHILLSHLHFDHVGGFFMLIQGFWLEKRTKKLVVHAPEDGIEPLRQMLRAGCIFDELLSFPLEFRPLTAGQPFHAGKVAVTPFTTTHLASLQRSFKSKYRQTFSAFCFLFEHEGLRIVHSADIGAVEDLAAALEKPVDLLVCELAHVPREKLFSFLARRQIRQVAFVHLSREYRQDFVETEQLAGKLFPSTAVSFPAQGDEIVL
jgi:ribonuclease Z